MRRILLLTLLVLGLSQPAKACDACSCAASNLSNWTELGNMRSAIGLQQQIYKFYLDGYALNDTVQEQLLHLSTLQAQYRLSMRWTIVGGVSRSSTGLLYPNTIDRTTGWGNANIGARYTRMRVIGGFENYFMVEGRGYLPTPSSGELDPLNLSGSPFGTSLQTAWLHKHRKWQFVLSGSMRYHSVRQHQQIGRALNMEALAAYTVREREQYKVQLQGSVSQFLQNADIEDTRTGAINQYSGGQFTAMTAGLGIYRKRWSFAATASVPVAQNLGNGTSELAPYLRSQLKYSW